MAYTLLTGATGLLGRYLMRDLLVRDEPLAVLVRKARKKTAEQRIDETLSYWEQKWKRSLPRPVVLEGDITLGDLGLGANQRDWLRQHCDSVIHSAASLTFYEDDGEPWRSNVDGVRNVLDVCRAVNIRQFDHISSCYVCGVRRGIVYEHELDVGQAYGNDYEKSKVMAEQLVRSADFLETYTVFRPSIIVGDSATGFTNTFHGFYTPLRLLCALLSNFDAEQVLNIDFMQMFALRGDERKNFVPVDWVSEAIVSILPQREERHHRTIALASQHPLEVARLTDLFRSAIRAFHPRARGSLETNRNVSNALPPMPDLAAAFPGAKPLLDTYLGQFAVYRSYWRDDPRFDDASREQLLPDLPCPKLTAEQLHRLCQYAIERNFAWAPEPAEPGESHARDWVSPWQADVGAWSDAAGMADGADRSVWGLIVTGNGGGAWTFRQDARGATTCVVGQQNVAAAIRMNSHTFTELVTGRVSLDASVQAGRILVTGDATGIHHFAELLAERAG